MKIILGAFALFFLILYVLGWFYPATIDDIATTDRGVLLALFIIFAHMAWDKH